MTIKSSCNENLHHHDFTLHIFQNYQCYCFEVGSIASLSGFLDYLINMKLINHETIRHYTILNEFNSMSQNKVYRNKTQTIKALANKYGHADSTIWNILKDHKNKFVSEREIIIGKEIHSLNIAATK